MNKQLSLVILIAGTVLAGLAFNFFQQAEKQEKHNDALTGLITSSYEDDDPYAGIDNTPPPALSYDPTDLDQTPPGVEAYLGSTMCSMQWGLQIRQYCADGDSALIDSVEGGFGAAENLRTLKLCLDDTLVRRDVYGQDKSYVESNVQKNETNRKALACELTQKYGDWSRFDRAGLFYMFKEHIESGHIDRLKIN